MLAMLWGSWGLAWQKNGNMEKAMEYFDKALTLAKKMENLQAIEWVERLIMELNKKTG